MVTTLPLVMTLKVVIKMFAQLLAAKLTTA